MAWASAWVIECVLASTTTKTYVGEILLLRLLATTTFTCSNTSPLLGGGIGSFIVARTCAWHFILQYKMIPSMHELLIAEYGRIFIQVPWNYYKPTPWNHSAIFLSGEWSNSSCLPTCSTCRQWNYTITTIQLYCDDTMQLFVFTLEDSQCSIQTIHNINCTSSTK